MSDCSSIQDRFFGPGRLDRTNPELEEHLASCPGCRGAAAAMPLVDRALADASRTPVPVPPFELIARQAASAARGRRRVVAVRRSFPLLVTGFATAAAALVLWLAVGHRPVKPPVAAPGTSIDGSAGARLAVLGSGARVRVDAGQLEFVASAPDGERLYMKSGSVSLEVPRLPTGRTLSVGTPDADVRVHGTRFQVVRDARGTSVSVAEGLVEVRPHGGGRPAVFLRAGESAGVEPLEGYRRGVRASAQSALEKGQYAAAEQHLGTLLATEPDRLERAEAHALLGWSAAASGDRRAAIGRYREALGMLPAGAAPLWADNAGAELALLLEQEEPDAAKAAWREYLQRFPHGVHTPLARARTASPDAEP